MLGEMYGKLTKSHTTHCFILKSEVLWSWSSKTLVSYHNTTQHNTTQQNITQTQHNTTEHNTTQQNTNTTQQNTTQHNTTQNRTEHNTTQHNTTHHNTNTTRRYNPEDLDLKHHCRENLTTRAALNIYCCHPFSYDIFAYLLSRVVRPKWMLQI